MGETLPYIPSPGTITTVLGKIQKAATPDKFDKRYMEDTLNMKGGSPAAFMPFAKRIGLLTADGTPTDLYKQFRGEGSKSPALAQAMRTGYRELFARDENVHKSTKEELRALVIQVTGAGEDAPMVGLIVSCFQKLNDGADFGRNGSAVKPKEEVEVEKDSEEADGRGQLSGKLTIGYTINLNLPETTNPAVFNAIFKALKEHLLRENS